MSTWFFVSDLHGDLCRYEKLFERIVREAPVAVLLGGDLLPSAFGGGAGSGAALAGFIQGILAAGFAEVRAVLGPRAPRVFVIPGNDDPRCEEVHFIGAGAGGLWDYAHGRRFELGRFAVYGYACVPPTPFRLKDWERYDVSRYVDPGCVSPEEGLHTVNLDEGDRRWGTIREDLERLTGTDDLRAAVLLFHAPPYQTPLDRAALDGRIIDHVPLDVHVGSIAIRRFIEHRQPLLTLHGHIHESARLTGDWRTLIGATHCLSAAHDGPELALIRFDPERPADASRELVSVG